MSLHDFPLPHNDAAERSTLGSMLREAYAIDMAIATFAPFGAEVFDVPAHQKIYKVITELHARGKPIDGELIRELATKRGTWDEFDGYKGLAEMINSVASPLRVEYYASIVRDKYLLRKIMGTLDLCGRKIQKHATAAEAIEFIQGAILDLDRHREMHNVQTAGELATQAIKYLSEPKGDLRGLYTGFPRLDQFLAGLQPGQLLVIGARPAVGKTALALNMAAHIALQRHPTLFFSLEMAAGELTNRLLASGSRVPSHKLRKRPIWDQDLKKLAGAKDVLLDSKLYIDDSSTHTIHSLRSVARVVHNRHRIECIFVDYLQLLRDPESARRSRQEEVARISGSLKALARDLEIPVVVVCQLNRQPDIHQKKPRMSDLRESGAIEQDADVVLLLHRDLYAREVKADENPDPTEVSDAELIIAKQRNGPVGVIKLHWHAKYTRFDVPADQTAKLLYGDEKAGYDPADDLPYDVDV